MPGVQPLSEEIFGAYAAGTLDPALVLLVETQAALRGDVQRMLHRADAIATSFFDQETPARLSDGALDRALAVIDRLPDLPTTKAVTPRVPGHILDELIRLPQPLQERAMSDLKTRQLKFAGPGLRVMELDVPGEAKVELLRIEPGHGAPKHTHEGNEYTLVVTGSFTDENGQYKPGELSIAGPDCLHQPIADPGEICYALAVTDGNLRFTGVLGMLQRVFG